MYIHENSEDVKSILEKLREEVRLSRVGGESRGDAPEPEVTPSIPPGATLRERVEDLEGRWVIKEQPFSSRFPLLGPVIAFIREIWNSVSTKWYVRSILQQQMDFNASVVRATQHVEGLLAILSQELAELRGELADEDRHTMRLGRQVGALDVRQNQLAAEAGELALTLAGVGEEVRKGEERWRRAGLEERLTRLERVWHEMRLQDPAVLSGTSPHLLTGEPAIPSGRAKDTPSLDYFLFELRFRGSSEDVKKQQREYLEFFSGLGDVLDIGCGRGEFLELLGEAGVSAKGIDLDPHMVDYCRAKGLEVIQGDALEYLEGLEDGCLGGIFMAQVVEHLESPQLMELIRLCYRKLRGQGVLVAETNNPMCLLGMATHFTIDPSHQRPVHPETMRFILEWAGFSEVQIRYTSPVPEELRLKPLEAPPSSHPAGSGQALSDSEGSEEWRATINRNIDKINDLLFGYQDYAAIARKGR